MMPWWPNTPVCLWEPNGIYGFCSSSRGAKKGWLLRHEEEICTKKQFFGRAIRRKQQQSSPLTVFVCWKLPAKWKPLIQHQKIVSYLVFEVLASWYWIFKRALAHKASAASCFTKSHLRHSPITEISFYPTRRHGQNNNCLSRPCVSRLTVQDTFGAWEPFSAPLT